jgi:hypothetical protein
MPGSQLGRAAGFSHHSGTQTMSGVAAPDHNSHTLKDLGCNSFRMTAMQILDPPMGSKTLVLRLPSAQEASAQMSRPIKGSARCSPMAVEVLEPGLSYHQATHSSKAQTAVP